MADRITFRPTDAVDEGLRRKAKETHGGNLSALINDWLRERLEEEGIFEQASDELGSQLEATMKIAGRQRVEQALRDLRESATQEN